MYNPKQSELWTSEKIWLLVFSGWDERERLAVLHLLRWSHDTGSWGHVQLNPLVWLHHVHMSRKQLPVWRHWYAPKKNIVFFLHNLFCRIVSGSVIPSKPVCRNEFRCWSPSQCVLEAEGDLCWWRGTCAYEDLSSFGNSTCARRSECFCSFCWETGSQGFVWKCVVWKGWGCQNHLGFLFKMDVEKYWEVWEVADGVIIIIGIIWGQYQGSYIEANIQPTNIRS